MLKWLLQDDGFQLALIASCVEVVFFSCQMDQVRPIVDGHVRQQHVSFKGDVFLLTFAPLLVDFHRRK